MGGSGRGELHLGFPILQTSVIPLLSWKTKTVAAPNRPVEKKKWIPLERKETQCVIDSAAAASTTFIRCLKTEKG